VIGWGEGRLHPQPVITKNRLGPRIVLGDDWLASIAVRLRPAPHDFQTLLCLAPCDMGYDAE
jgi:hypothetical protein